MLKHFCNPVNYVVRNSSEDYTYYYPFVNNGEIMCYLKIETLTPLVLDLRDFRIALEKVTTFNGEDFLSQYYKLQKRTLDLRIKEGDCICRTNITDEFTVTSIEDVSTTWVKLVTKYNLRYPKLRTAPNVKKFCAITDDEGKSYLGRISFNNVGKGTPAMCMELNVYREISDILEKYNVSDIESLSIYELEDYISNKGTMMTWYRDRDRTSIWFKHTPLDRIYLVTLGLYADKLLDDLQDIFCGYKIEKFLNVRG